MISSQERLYTLAMDSLRPAPPFDKDSEGGLGFGIFLMIPRRLSGGR